jgi:hypothetical protein
MKKLKIPHETRTCRLCNGESQAPWPPVPGGGPTHHTCHPGEERQTLEEKYMTEEWHEEHKIDILLKKSIKLLMRSNPPLVPLSKTDSGMGLIEDINWIAQRQELIKDCGKIFRIENSHE